MCKKGVSNVLGMLLFSSPILTPIIFEYTRGLMVRAGLGGAGVNKVTQVSLSRIQLS